LAIRIGDEEHGSYIEEINNNQIVGVVLDKTSFYCESGGQIYDTGYLSNENDETHFKVLDVQEYGGYIVHTGLLTRGELSVGNRITCYLNYSRREPIKSNHTTTHMLNFGLKKIIGDDVEQRGSLVTEEKFRFDFSVQREISPEEILSIEDIVNDIILKEYQVFTQEIPLDVAFEINGIRAVFGEKYPDPVRVVSIGVDLDEVLKDLSNERWSNYSIEFCGGTHLSNSRESGKFAIVDEISLGSGIRRIVAVTGDNAKIAFDNVKKFGDKLLVLEQLSDEEISNAFKEYKQEIDSCSLIPLFHRAQFSEKLDPIKHRVDTLYKMYLKLMENQAKTIKEEIIEKLNNENINLVVEIINVGGNKKVLGKLVNEIFDSVTKDIAVILISIDEEENKIISSAKVSKNLSDKLSAIDWIRSYNNDETGGRGGGSKMVASGDTVLTGDIQQIIHKAMHFAREKLM